MLWIYITKIFNIGSNKKNYSTYKNKSKYRLKFKTKEKLEVHLYLVNLKTKLFILIRILFNKKKIINNLEKKT